MVTRLYVMTVCELKLHSNSLVF